jgi:hypothetical protein
MAVSPAYRGLAGLPRVVPASDHGQDGDMPVAGADLVSRAAAELYSLDPSAFIDRRAALATAAKEQGEANAAKQIAGLRKPTVSAWTVNSLAREHPELVEELVELGQELRAAQESLDGGQLRDLAPRRRAMIDALARQAFSATGQRPSAAVQEEVTATLSAALADPETAEGLRGGMLVKAVRWDGFGPVGRPDLAVVPDPKPQGRPVERRPDPRGADERRSGGLPAEEGRVARLSQLDRAEQDRAEQDRAEQDRAEQDRAEQDRAEQDRAEQGRSEDRRRLRAGAERGVAVATKKLARARDTERSKAERLEELQARIDEARRALDEARFEVRRSQGELAEAEQELADLAD